MSALIRALRRPAAVLVAIAVLGAAPGCVPSERPDEDLSRRPIRVVATTNIVADLVRDVGGDRLDVTALMGPGVDPHLYKASEGDVTRMSRADFVFYGGLHLEGKMVEVFEQMEARGRRAVAVTDGVPREELIESPDYGGSYDPHVWFDVMKWARAGRHVAEVLATADTVHAADYRARADDLEGRYRDLDAYVRERVDSLPAERRVLITSHDAFGYFGLAYGFEVRGLQGLSTATEAGTADVQRLAEFVASNRIPTLFVESSVPRRGIEAVREAVRSRGFDVVIGGSLYSDALGNPDSDAGTYAGMVRSNVDTIVDGLSR